MSVMTYEEIFTKFKDMFKDADVGGVYAEVKDGKLTIEPYEYFDRDALFICSAEVLFKIIAGELDPVKAFTFGKLKVEGSLEQALKINNLIEK